MSVAAISDYDYRSWMQRWWDDGGWHHDGCDPLRFASRFSLTNYEAEHIISDIEELAVSGIEPTLAHVRHALTFAKAARPITDSGQTMVVQWR